MSNEHTNPGLPLVDALLDRERAYRAAVYRLRDEDSPEATDLREAVELIGCLRRLLDGRSTEEIHRAFGAPGDFGYDTPIGDALRKTYGL